jgi:DNA polymerase elongation subunit (family B)
MEKGRTPSPSSPPLYGLDIETDTSVDGLDPLVGRVLAVAVSGPRVVLFDHDDEADLLRRLDQHLAELPPGVIVTWNGARFDLPYLASRATIAGVDLGLRLWADPTCRDDRGALPGHTGTYRASWFGHDHLDAYRVYRADVGPALRIGCSLKTVARLAGLAPVEVDASRVHDLTPSEMAAYVGSDARCTAELARRRWATARLAVDRPVAPGSITAEALR